MRILFINHTCGIGSTGRICTDLAKKYMNEGNECVIAYGRGEVPEAYKKISKRIGSAFNAYAHAIYTRVTDRHGFGSRYATKKFLEWAQEYNPDILWLHNIHGYYINIELLFKWIKSRPQMQVKWTLHDCWSFTGHCSYFTMIKCDKWKEHCSCCPQKHEYPESFVMDNSHRNYDRKKELFTGVKKMTLITPSQWLADLVKQSFMKEYPVEVVYNSINLDIFKPTDSDFREKYHLQDKKIVLGVANIWSDRKGLSDFIQLAEMLDDSYVIVLVGLTKKQVNRLPKQIKGIERTNNISELVAVYSASDYFVNPSREETFGMTTVEASACGCKTIVYKDTACEEIAIANGGMVVQPSVENIYKAITGVEYPKNHRGGVFSIICIPRTSDAVELAGIYSTSDFFVNPTHEDNYPTVNLEARASGTTVITYDTGGAKETLI